MCNGLMEVVDNSTTDSDAGATFVQMGNSFAYHKVLLEEDVEEAENFYRFVR